ncbi:heterogeneous nuclear ribonucleoprotein u-like protein 1 [Phtheirospermum japonicum]|uniref:Heterogeneous nuclear ribonucleoprotein u-like protein 1 n=1 Tax=Phtheirospermum japonicum TaxID=374723 RepID=A0A830CXL2_9LAMI|nr:heterogeneous nuclear ribonucleoprotein u-like protein 1 [Phtheirospermum japonicum]
MASTKREFPFSDEFQLKKAKVDEWEPSSSSGAGSNLRVVLNPADCDIDFNVEGDGLRGSALYEEGFAYCWSGARANIGITRGKYCFGCKIVSAQPVQMEDTPLDLQNVCRVGLSRGDDDVRNLGETLNSFGFGGTGKFSNSGNFPNYGERFGVGDTIICAVDLESFPMASIGFSKNGNWLGVAKHFDAGPNGLGVVGSPVKGLHWESAVFPHVLLKNVLVELQFSIDDGLNPVEGYKPWDAAILDGNAMLGPAFSNVDDCEVIMLVGLPASGKTTWAEKWVKEHREKRYVLLGTNLALEQMKVPGLLRKNNYGERFQLLMDRATKIFNALLTRASKIPRNFILDQTNVYKSARKRKLKPFADFIKIAAVVFPRSEELKIRSDKRSKEMGKEVPSEAVNEMLANFTLPMQKDMHMTDEYFDQVWFVELGREESQRVLNEMKREMREKPCVGPDTHGKNSVVSCRGVGGSYQSSYPLQPLSGAPYWSGYSNLSSYGVNGGNVYQNYGTGDANNYYTSGVAINSGPSNFAGPYPTITSSSSYNSGDYSYANAPGGPQYHTSDMAAHPAPPPQPATHFPHVSYPIAGSYGTPVHRAPIGSYQNDEQQAGVNQHPYPQGGPSLNLPMDVEPNYGSYPNDTQQCFGEYPQAPPRFLRPPPPPMNLTRDVSHSGFYAAAPHRY